MSLHESSHVNDGLHVVYSMFNGTSHVRLNGSLFLSATMQLVICQNHVPGKPTFATDSLSSTWSGSYTRKLVEGHHRTFLRSLTNTG